MPRVACVMMQKNESGLLRPWITYHGYLFGFENLFIFDNGSTNPAVAATLDLFGRLGVKIDRGRDTRQDYLDKGIIVGDCIRRLQQTGDFDLLMPLDCDEFVVRKIVGGITCDKADIHGYLEFLVGQPRILRVPYQFANNPLIPDIYGFFDFHKVFFAAAPCVDMDRGYHDVAYDPDTSYCTTDIIHLHFHHRPFRHQQAASREKWSGDIDCNDIEKMQHYNSGASMHLRDYFIGTDVNYYTKFLHKPFIVFPLFRQWLLSISPDIDLRYDHREISAAAIEPVPQEVPPRLVGEYETYIPIEPSRLPPGLPQQKTPGMYGFNLLYRMCEKLQIPPNSMNSGFFAAVPFNEDDYLALNRDIVAAAKNPVEHFFGQGYRELHRPMATGRTLLQTASVMVSLG